MAVRAFAVSVVLMLASCSFTFTTSNSSTSTQIVTPSLPLQTPASGFTTYSNADPAFVISHPSGWREHRLVASDPGVSTAIVAFSTRLDGPSDYFTENVVVSRNVVPDGMTLDEYTAFSIANKPKTVTNFQLVLKQPAILSGLPAEALEYTGTASNRSLHWFTEWAVSGTSAYVISYMAEPDSYDRYLQDAKATIESFHLT
ncbi:MAG: hypothetical protein QOE25_614 [Actinomycetota bacterium]|jgi:hypothetical protein|nr:hypothetical protein [Actinomycetota bacterium]